MTSLSKETEDPHRDEGRLMMNLNTGNSINLRLNRDEVAQKDYKLKARGQHH